MSEPVKRKRCGDAELVAVLVKVILDEGTVSSQKRLAELVNKQLKKRSMHVTGERVRVLAVKSGLVGISVRARVDGPTPELDRCPVCRAKLKRTSNRTLSAFDASADASSPRRGAATGNTTQTGYKCARCPYWTGRELRIPMHYVFQARVARSERGQVTFASRDRG
ncbi:MAG TPA: hypothetical protein VM370_02470 [Candidatus Thermoplasmatota archaeon]|nr:hypothetical protein [Candidatus Thermoplasmatota archaeon]